MTPNPERISAVHAAAICGVHRRTINGWANRGMIPGAAMLGGVWRFDERALRQWIAEREAESCQKIYIAAERSGGRVCRFGVSSYDEAYEQLFSPKRAKGSRR